MVLGSSGRKNQTKIPFEMNDFIQHSPLVDVCIQNFTDQQHAETPSHAGCPGNPLWPFWDEEKRDPYPYSKFIRDLQLGDKKVTNWITWVGFLLRDFFLVCKDVYQQI